jgi:uncharacterized sulfatase
MARTGKIYHGGLAEDAGWDLKEDNPSVPPELAAKTRVAAEGGRLPPPGPVKKGKRTPAMYWRSIDGPDEAQRDGQLAVKAVEFIRKRPKGKPFFMAIGFWKPHAPYIAPSKYFDLYPVDSIQLPKVPRNDWADLPPEAYAGLTAWNQDISDEHAREFIRAYYACISFMDAQLGKALNALEEASVLEDTVIVFWGDNGYLLTEHGMWHKNRLFEEACRVPLIATAPGRKARGVGCSRLVEFVDIYPTLAELCGLPAPEGVEGTSFAPLMDDPSRPWKKAAFTQTATGRSVRTQRWRYTEWGGPEKAELYDHEAEPSEHTNLAKDPKCAATVKELHDLLEKGWRAALP